MSQEKVCPLMSEGGTMQNCIGGQCMLWVEGNTSSTCALVKLPRKAVIRLDTLSAQVQEMQILLNQLASKP